MKGGSTIKCINTSVIYILSKWQCGFRKGFSIQHCLLVMKEKWQKYLNKGVISGAILTDLSKAFDCILHNLVVGKLAAYCFDYQSESWKIFFPINSKGQKFITTFVVILKLYMEFRKGHFWVPYFSISISAAYFLT